jgi:hypothetical protein
METATAASTSMTLSNQRAFSPPEVGYFSPLSSGSATNGSFNNPAAF